MLKKETTAAKTPVTVNDKSNSFVVLKWILIFAIVVAILFIATSPLRGKAAQNYIKEGDKFLSENKYVSAEVEYDKALKLNSKDNIAKERKQLATDGANNILALANFYQENFTDKKLIMEQATSFPENEVAAVKSSRQLIEQGEYQLAAIPAETATKMDPDYRDAWLYLGIANYKTATLVELKPETQNIYKEKSKESLKKVLELEPSNSLAKELLGKSE